LWRAGILESETLKNQQINFVQRNRSQVLGNTPNIIQEVKKVTLKQEMEESGESTKNMRRDPRLVLYLLSSI
jgi:hypothetical protein